MKKILCLLLLICTIAANSQKTSIVTVNTVRPKNGQRMAFDAAYKAHIAKFHKTVEKIYVYEILTGKYVGYYNLVEPDRTFASFDSSRADAAAHGADLDKNFFPMLQDNINGNFRYVDSLSLHPDIHSDKEVVNIRHIKPSLLADYRAELSRGIKLFNKTKGLFWENLSLGVYELLWSGNDPVIVTVRVLKDGFKSLETDFYGPVTPDFKDEYIKAYGTLDWDKRLKLFDEAVVTHEQYLQKFRADLSSQ